MHHWWHDALIIAAFVVVLLTLISALSWRRQQRDRFDDSGTIVCKLGEQGPPGVAGPRGDQGVAGSVGVQGMAGAQGSTGVAGAAGGKGDAGAKGDKGDQGDQGASGVMGLPGPAGTMPVSPGLTFDVYYIPSPAPTVAWAVQVGQSEAARMDFFRAKTPNDRGVVSRLDVGGNMSTLKITDGNSAALRVGGRFKATSTGLWKFRVAADDLVDLWVGDAAASPGTSNTPQNKLLYVDYRMGTQTTATMQMTAGTLYPFLLYWGQGNGGLNLTLVFTPPGGQETGDGTGVYFH